MYSCLALDPNSRSTTPGQDSIPARSEVSYTFEMDNSSDEGTLRTSPRGSGGAAPRFQQPMTPTTPREHGLDKELANDAAKKTNAVDRRDKDYRLQNSAQKGKQPARNGQPSSSGSLSINNRSKTLARAAQSDTVEPQISETRPSRGPCRVQLVETIRKNWPNAPDHLVPKEIIVVNKLSENPNAWPRTLLVQLEKMSRKSRDDVLIAHEALRSLCISVGPDGGNKKSQTLTADTVTEASGLMKGLKMSRQEPVSMKQEQGGPAAVRSANASFAIPEFANEDAEREYFELEKIKAHGVIFSIQQEQNKAMQRRCQNRLNEMQAIDLTRDD